MKSQKFLALHQLDEFCSTLAHRDRIRVFARLCQGTCTVTQLTKEIKKNGKDMLQTNVSQILRGLREAGLTEHDKKGQSSLNWVPDRIKESVLPILFTLIEIEPEVQRIKKENDKDNE